MTGVPIVLLAIAAVGLARLGYRGFLSREARVRRALARRPRVQIDAASGRKLRVTGRVRPRGEPLIAPVSGRPCVAFQLFVEERNGRRWIDLLELRDAQSFTVADETGEALVDTSGPFALALVPDEQGAMGWFDRITPAQLQALRSTLGSRATTWYGGWKRLRFKEGLLETDDRVSVGGSGEREQSPEGQSNLREPPERLVLRGTADEPLLIGDSRDAVGHEASRPPGRDRES